jgi:hypothetical protein
MTRLEHCVPPANHMCLAGPILRASGFAAGFFCGAQRAAGVCFDQRLEQAVTGCKRAMGVRLSRDGRLDRTFGRNGRLTLRHEGKRTTIEAVAIQPDGKVIAAPRSGIRR